MRISTILNPRTLLQIGSCLSLDVAATVTCWYLYACHLANTPASLAVALVIFLSILLAYWADHWMDIRQLKGSFTNAPSRLQFLHKHRKLLVKSAIILLPADIIIASTQLSAIDLQTSLILGALGIAYLIYAPNTQANFPKECATAILLGLTPVAYVFYEGTVLLSLGLWASYASLCMCALLLTSFWEQAKDSAQGLQSIALQHHEHIHKLIRYSFLLPPVFICTTLFFSDKHLLAATPLFLSCFAMIYCYPEPPLRRPFELHMLMDWVLLLPVALYLLIA